jgi:hypothetical protein
VVTLVEPTGAELVVELAPVWSAVQLVKVVAEAAVNNQTKVRFCIPWIVLRIDLKGQER